MIFLNKFLMWQILGAFSTYNNPSYQANHAFVNFIGQTTFRHFVSLFRPIPCWSSLSCSSRSSADSASSQGSFRLAGYSHSQSNVELAIKNQGAIIIFQVHHHDFRGKQILITFSKALIKFAIDMLYYHFFWPKTPSRNNKLLQKPSRNKKKSFLGQKFFLSNSLLNLIRALLKVTGDMADQHSWEQRVTQSANRAKDLESSRQEAEIHIADSESMEFNMV